MTKSINGPATVSINLLLLLTISQSVFWAKAREPLNVSEEPGADVTIPRGQLFMGLKPQNGIGFFLGTDGFTIQQYSPAHSYSIVVQREPLIGWHHYSIVVENREPYVYRWKRQSFVDESCDVKRKRDEFSSFVWSYSLSLCGVQWTAWYCFRRMDQRNTIGKSFDAWQ